MRTFILVTVAAIFLVRGDARAQCQEFSEVEESFRAVYPTGGRAGHFQGQEGREVLDKLLAGDDGRAVAFLYSGDGPITGARGRYLYMVLDEEECILKKDWIDGAIYDRLTAAD